MLNVFSLGVLVPYIPVDESRALHEEDVDVWGVPLVCVALGLPECFGIGPRLAVLAPVWGVFGSVGGLGLREGRGGGGWEDAFNNGLQHIHDQARECE